MILFYFSALYNSENEIIQKCAKIDVCFDNKFLVKGEYFSDHPFLSDREI